MKHPKEWATTPEISKRMGRVRLKRGKAETALAKALWRRGWRYRLNLRSLPGSPDIALTKYRLAVFVDGEFWHGEDWETRKGKLRSNRDYWIEKIEENIARDRRDGDRLRALGWTVLRFWEKEVLRDLDGCVSTVESALLEQIADRVSDGDVPPGRENF